MAAALVFSAASALQAGDFPGLQEPLKTVTRDYLVIQQKLASDSFDGVTAEAANLKLAMTMKSPVGTPTSVAFAPDFFKAVDALVAAGDLHTARLAFTQVSMCLIAALAQDHAQTGSLHTVFCPMRKAYWVQTDGQKVENPYFGAAMLDCGEFQRQF